MHLSIALMAKTTAQSVCKNKCLFVCLFKSLPSTCFVLLYILKRKRNATLSKMIVPTFSSKKSANDNEIANYRYLPCIQNQNQTAVTYGWRDATGNVRQPPFLKSQSSKIVPSLRKNVFNQYRF